MKLRYPGPRISAFTLVEILTVLAVMAILMALLAPAIIGIAGGRETTGAADDIAGALEQARTYAMANNTYVWIGFFEEDGAQPSTRPATAGTGRVVMSLVASKDGSRYSDTLVDSSTPPAFGFDTAASSKNQVSLVQLGKLIKLNNTHLASLNDGMAVNSGNRPARPAVQAAYQIGDPGFAKHVQFAGGVSVMNPTTFTWPLTVAGAPQTPQYTFVKIIEFSPQGETAKIVENVFCGPGPQDRMEIAIQPAHGNAVDDRRFNSAGAAIQIEGMTGQVQVFLP